MSRRILSLAYDMTSRQLIGDTSILYSAVTQPLFVYEEDVIVQLSLYKVSSSAYTAYTDLLNTDLFSATVNTDYASSTVNLTESDNSQFNIVADWASVSPVAGRICFRMSFDTTALATALGTSSALTDPQLEILIRPSTGTYISGTIRFTVSVANIMSHLPLTVLVKNTDYTPTAASTSTITMLTDQTVNITVGAFVKIGVAGSYVYGIVQSITAGLLTLHGVTLPLGAAAIESLSYETLPKAVTYGIPALTESTAILNGYQDKDSDAVEGNYAKFTAKGETVDGGSVPVDFLTDYLRVEHSQVLNFLQTVSNIPLVAAQTNYGFLVDTLEITSAAFSGLVSTAHLSVGTVANPTLLYGPTALVTPLLAGYRQVIELNSNLIPANTAIVINIGVAGVGTTHYGHISVTGTYVSATFAAWSSSSSSCSSSVSSRSSVSSSSSSRSSSKSSSSSSSKSSSSSSKSSSSSSSKSSSSSSSKSSSSVSSSSSSSSRPSSVSSSVSSSSSSVSSSSSKSSSSSSSSKSSSSSSSKSSSSSSSISSSSSSISSSSSSKSSSSRSSSSSSKSSSSSSRSSISSSSSRSSVSSSSSRSVSSSSSTYAVDPYCVTLLHGNTSIADSALAGNAPHTFLATGSAAISTTTPKFGAGCISLPNSVSYYQTITGLADYASITNGKFCIEFFLRFLETPTGIEGFYIGSPDGMQVRVGEDTGGSGNFKIALYNAGTLVATTVAFIASSWSTTWHYINVQRDNSGKVRIALDGTSYYYDTYATSFATPSYFRIGGTASLACYVDELRVSKGTSRSYAVPASEFSPYLSSSMSSSSSSSSKSSSSSSSSSRSSVSSSSSSSSSRSSVSSSSSSSTYSSPSSSSISSSISSASSSSSSSRSSVSSSSSSSSRSSVSSSSSSSSRSSASSSSSSSSISSASSSSSSSRSSASSSSSSSSRSSVSSSSSSSRSSVSSSSSSSSRSSLSSSSSSSSRSSVSSSSSSSSRSSVSSSSSSSRSSVSSSSSSRSSASSSSAMAETAYSFAGYTTEGIKTTYAYDAGGNSWSTKADIPSPARYQVGAVVVSSKAYVYGGYTTVSVKTNDEYDPGTNGWTNKTDMPSPARYGPAATTISTKCYACCGYSTTFIDDMDEYTPSGNSWANKTNFHSSYDGVAAGTVSSKGYFIGGRNGAGGHHDNAEYDATGNSWTNKNGPPICYRTFSKITVISTYIYMLGGQDIEHGGTPWLTRNDQYTAADDTWAVKTAMPAPARGFIGASTVYSKGYSYGGYDGANPIADTDEYTPGGDSWASKTDISVALYTNAGVAI